MHVHTEPYKCSRTITDQTMLWNMSTRELTVVEKLERSALRGFPGHITGDTMPGETDSSAGRRHGDQGCSYRRRGSWLTGRDWVSTTCWLALEKCWHVL